MAVRELVITYKLDDSDTSFLMQMLGITDDVQKEQIISDFLTRWRVVDFSRIPQAEMRTFWLGGQMGGLISLLMDMDQADNETQAQEDARKRPGGRILQLRK